MAFSSVTRKISLAFPEKVWAYFEKRAERTFTPIEEQFRVLIVAAWNAQSTQHDPKQLNIPDHTSGPAVPRPQTLGRKSSSGYRGVYRYGRKRWAPMITVGQELKRLGRKGGYDDPVQAARVYDAEVRRLFGDGAIVNFPANDNERGADGRTALDRQLEAAILDLASSTPTDKETFRRKQQILFDLQVRVADRDVARQQKQQSQAKPDTVEDTAVADEDDDRIELGEVL